MATFTPNPNITRGPTQASGSTHQFTGSVEITGSLTLNGSAVTGGGGGSGDVTGPGAATDNAIARYDLTTGKIIQNSGVIIDDSNNITGIVDLASTGNTTLGNSLTDSHQVSGTLSISGSQPLVVYGPGPGYTGGPTIIARNTSSVGGANMWEQPASGALIVSADTWGTQKHGSVMYVHSNGVASTIGFKNSSTDTAGIQSNKVTSGKGAFVGLQNADLFLRNEIGNLILTADGSQEIVIDSAGTTIGNASSDYHQVSGTLAVSGTANIYGPVGNGVGGPTIITRNTASFGDHWEQPMSGALIISDDVGSGGTANGVAPLYIHSQKNLAVIGFKNEDTLVGTIPNQYQSNYLTNVSGKGAYIGLQDKNLVMRSHLTDGAISLLVEGAQEILIEKDGTTIGNNASDYHQVSGTLDVSGSVKALGFAPNRVAYASTTTITDVTAIAGVTSGSITLTLPAVSTFSGSTLIIKDESGTVSGSNTVIVSCSSGVTIDGVTTATISSPYGSISTYHDGTNWFIY